MTGNGQVGTRRKFLTRCLAVVALLGVYALGTLAVSGLAITTGVTSAQARGGGGGRGGGGRGGGRGFGRGFGRGMGRGFGRGFGRGRGRGWWGGGGWAPGCHQPWTSAWVYCSY
jgi:hypothetical protein